MVISRDLTVNIALSSQAKSFLPPIANANVTYNPTNTASLSNTNEDVAFDQSVQRNSNQEIKRIIDKIDTAKALYETHSSSPGYQKKFLFDNENNISKILEYIPSQVSTTIREYSLNSSENKNLSNALLSLDRNTYRLNKEIIQSNDSSVPYELRDYDQDSEGNTRLKSQNLFYGLIKIDFDYDLQQKIVTINNLDPSEKNKFTFNLKETEQNLKEIPDLIIKTNYGDLVSVKFFDDGSFMVLDSENKLISDFDALGDRKDESVHHSSSGIYKEFDYSKNVLREIKPNSLLTSYLPGSKKNFLSGPGTAYGIYRYSSESEKPSLIKYDESGKRIQGI